MAREKVYEASVKIVGVTPMLMHKCGVIEKKATSSTTDYSEEWIKTVYLDQSQKYVAIPSMNLEAMFRDASKGHKIGKSFMTKIVPTGLIVNEFEIPVYDEKGKQITIEKIQSNNWLFSCAAVVQKNRVNRIRACLPPGWNMEFSITIINPILKPDVVEALAERAGYEAGLCDWRPGAPKPGKFGQFELVSFDVIS